MKLHNLYRKIGNKKRQLIMTDVFTEVQNRKKTLAKSYQRQKVSLTIEEADDDEEKFRKEPCDRWRSYNTPQRPKRKK